MAGNHDDEWPDDLAADAAKSAPIAKASIWGSPAGKARLAKRLVGMLPAHKTYVEPFAGAASVLFAKEPAETEVVNDLDPDIAHAYKAIKGLSPDGLKKLKAMNWTGSKSTFERVYDSNPTGDVEKLYKFLYLAAHSYGSMRKRSMDPSSDGQTPKVMDRLEKQLARVKKLTVRSGDYAQVVKDYDSKDTLFYLDPPYTGYNAAVKEDEFDDEKFFDVLKSIKGRFLLTCGIRGPLPQNVRKQGGWTAKTIRPPRTIGSMKGVGGPKVLSTLLASNYPLSESTKKALSALEADGFVVKDYEPEVDKAWDDLETGEVEKGEYRQPFGTFGGSFRYAERLAKKIPEHKVYVEPFAGAAAVLYRKEPVDKEVLADLDDDVVFLHKYAKGIDEATVARLKKYDWSGTQANWQRVIKLEPKNDDERFFKLVYRRTMGRDARPDATHMAGAREGQAGPNPEKFLKAAARLKGVDVIKSDYKATIKKYDGPDTFFFIDPPYPGEWFDKSKAVDINDFVDVLKTIKGKFIAVVNDNAEHTAAFKSVGKVFRLAINEASGTGGGKQAKRLFVSNFDVRKAFGEDVEPDDGQRSGTAKSELAIEWKFQRVEKAERGADAPHEVFGEVLVPDEVDAQGDTYSVEEVEAACRKFNEVTAEEGQADHAGRQHSKRLSIKGVRIIESYCAPADMVVEGRKIKKGTWLMRWQILDPALWADIEADRVTGFSIGGSAVKTAIGKCAVAKAGLDGIVKPGAGAQHRLTDIEVNEVSAVDRAANKRKFIIVKSEDGMAGEHDGDVEKAGPFIGPKGGKYADAQHKIPWHPPTDRYSGKMDQDQHSDMANVHAQEAHTLRAAAQRSTHKPSKSAFETAAKLHDKAKAAHERAASVHGTRGSSARDRDAATESAHAASNDAQDETSRARAISAANHAATWNKPAKPAKKDDSMTDEERLAAAKAKLEEDTEKNAKDEADADAAQKAAAEKTAKAKFEADAAQKAKDEADAEAAQKAAAAAFDEAAKAAGAANHPADCTCPICESMKAAKSIISAGADEPAKKAASAHMALLNEKKDALVKAAGDLVGAVDKLDVDKGMAALDAMSSIVWKMRDDFSVVKLTKSETPAAHALIEKAQAEARVEIEKAHAELATKRALIVAKKAAGACATVDPEKKKSDDDKLDKALDALAGVTKALGEVHGRLDKMEKAQQAEAEEKAKAKAEAEAEKAKDEKLAGVTKALIDMSGRLAKIEKTTPAPNSAPAGGRSGTEKSDEEWPSDMARK